MSDDDETFTVSDAMWAAMATVVTNYQGQAATYISRTPLDDQIARRTAKALVDRGFITTDPMGQRCWPTPGGQTAFQSYLRRSTP